MKKKFFRSALSLLLAVTMLPGLLPVFAPSADAAELGNGDWLPDGVYEIASKKDQSYVLDTVDGGTAFGTSLCVNKSSGSDSQKWIIQRAVVNGEPTDYFTIRNLRANAYLDVENGDSEDGTRLQITDAGLNNCRYFYLDNNSDGTFSIRGSCNGKYAHLNGAYVDTNNVVHCWDGSGADQARYYFKPVNYSYDGFRNGGSFFINTVCGPDPHFGLTVANGSTAASANLQLNGFNRENYQVFAIEPTADGHYTLRARHSGRLITLENKNTDNCANIVQGETGNVSDYDKWNVIPNVDGSFSFVSYAANRYLDLSNGTVEENQNIQLWQSNWSSPQKWSLVPLLVDGVYEISSALDTDYVLDIQNNSTDDGGLLCLNLRNRGDNAQKWVVQHVYDLSLIHI